MELNGGPKEFSFQLGGWDQRRLHYTECPVFNCGLNRLNSTTDVRCVSTLSLWKIIFFANATNSAGALILSRCRIIFQMKCFELRCETPEVRIKDGSEGEDLALFLSKSKSYFCKNQNELFRPMIFLPWHFESPKHCWIWGKWDLWRKHHKCITKINQKDKQPASDGAGRWNAPQLARALYFWSNQGKYNKGNIRVDDLDDTAVVVSSYALRRVLHFNRVSEAAARVAG